MSPERASAAGTSAGRSRGDRVPADEWDQTVTQVEEITFEAAGEGSKPKVKIRLRPVTYERVSKGGGGPSGMTKPIQ